MMGLLPARHPRQAKLPSLQHSPSMSQPVSYTHLRAHETDSYLFVGSVRMCIRDRLCCAAVTADDGAAAGPTSAPGQTSKPATQPKYVPACLLYTSPSPRDGLLSIRRQRQDVYKRQVVLCGGDCG